MDNLIELVDWSRAQFALTAIYHWLFVPLTLGLGVIVAVMETIYFRTKSEKWLATTKFWMTIFGVNFAIGVATGIIMEFEFGTNWSNYSWFVGDIFGAPLAIEGILAFFMESTFIAVMFFGWKRVSPKFHLASTWLTAIGASISALWILVANAWMQHPVGMEFNPETMRNEMVDFWAIVASPMAVSKFFHTVMSGWTLAGVFVIGVSSWMLLRRRNTEHSIRSLKVGGWVGLIGIVATVATGDSSAVTVAKHQPMKLAAMEGLYDGKIGQDIVAVGILTPGKTHNDDKDPFVFDISIPYGLSVLANHDANSFVPGINDLIKGVSLTPQGDTINTVSYEERIARGKLAVDALRQFNEAVKAGDTAKAESLKSEIAQNFNYFGYGHLNSVDEAVPNVPLTFYTFHIMVIIGGMLLAFIAAALLFAYKRKWLERINWKDWFYKFAILAIPLTYLCSVSGWVVAEVGRQPWTIQDLMPNSIAISDISVGYVQTTFCIFAVIFTALLVADICIICKQISKKSKDDLETVK
ncbi:MAG: cytochrome ubiquinol oxidase subunit I [Candidatus Limisoma sp.]